MRAVSQTGDNSISALRTSSASQYNDVTCHKSHHIRNLVIQNQREYNREYIFASTIIIFSFEKAVSYSTNNVSAPISQFISCLNYRILRGL